MTLVREIGVRFPISAEGHDKNDDQNNACHVPSLSYIQRWRTSSTTPGTSVGPALSESHKVQKGVNVGIASYLSLTRLVRIRRRQLEGCGILRAELDVLELVRHHLDVLVAVWELVHYSPWNCGQPATEVGEQLRQQPRPACTADSLAYRALPP
eukprot:scaffold207_cov267-Pinguiococcus_pyrenoidosus.AAC.6